MNYKCSPLRIASPAAFPNLGLSLCPGKLDPYAMTGPTSRNLQEDIAVIKNWGASLVVSLLEDFELELLGVRDLGKAVAEAGMEWRHWPVVDGSPLLLRKNNKINQWNEQIREFGARMDKGEKIFIHCRGGLGRTGTLAARILVEKGVTAPEAMNMIRLARPGAIETREQEKYLLERAWER